MSVATVSAAGSFAMSFVKGVKNVFGRKDRKAANAPASYRREATTVQTEGLRGMLRWRTTT